MSNSLGDIYGTVKNGKSCIKLESEIVDINGIEINSDGSSLVPISNGMIVQVQHKDYKKTVTKSGTGWSAIDNNLETGFVVAIKPSSSASNVLVSCNLQIGMHASQDARYWGARLYRKIGNGDWTRVTEAENNDSVAGQTPQPTPVWLSDGMGVVQSNDDNFQISNLGNSFLDSPNTTETVYYTIYWKCKLGQPDGDANVVLHLNRAHSMLNTYSALPISNITAKEIWNSGKIYTPPTTLITTDEINNVVNVTSNLTVANNKVITVPTTDSDGNALTADTTYEITTGPAGSIDNISFVKKQESYFLSATGSLSNPLHSGGDAAGSHPTMKNWTILCSSTTASGDLSATTGKWTCPETGVYFIYYQSYYSGRYLEQAHTAINIHNPGVNDNTNPNLSIDYTPVVGFMFTPFRSDGQGQDPHRDDVGDVPQPITTMRTITQGETVHLTLRVASGGYHNIYGSAELQIRRIN